MPNQHTVSPLYLVARDYAKANPDTTQPQLRQLFPGISQYESKGIMRAARRQSIGWKPKPKPKTQAVKTRPVEKHRYVSPGTRAMSAERAKRVEAAIVYTLEHPEIFINEISKKFRVPTPPLSEARNAENARLAALAPPRPKRNRLMAWVDGVRVDLRAVREFSMVERFEGVKI